MRRHGKSPRTANATLTAGFRCAPETVPMNRITAITINPGAVTAAPRPIAPWVKAFTTGAPAPASTSRNVPNSSENSRRHSREASSNRRAHGGPARHPLAELVDRALERRVGKRHHEAALVADEVVMVVLVVVVRALVADHRLA